MKKQYPNGNSSDPQPVNRVLEGQRLRPILEHAHKNLALTEQLKKILPVHIAPHCNVLNLDKDVLFIEVANAHWGMYLRYAHNELLEQLNTSPIAKNIKKIEVKIRPFEGTEPPKKKLIRALNEESRTIIRNCAAHISDQQLKLTLLKISKDS